MLDKSEILCIILCVIKSGGLVSQKEALKKLKELKEKYTLHELVMRLNIQQTTLHRWIKTGKISRNMADLLERRIKDVGL